MSKSTPANMPLATVRRIALSAPAPGAERINAAWDAAIISLTHHAIVVGQLLLEQKAFVSPLCHDGTTGKFSGKKGSSFDEWLDQNCPQIPRRTAFRWMDLADRVSRVIRRIGVGLPCSQTLELSTGETIPISMALTQPPEELPETALQYRNDVLEFVSGKTMKDCLAAVIVEGDETHRISRAGNGQVTGGTRGEDRKDYPSFVEKKIGHITHFVEATSEEVAQARIIASFDTALSVWPDWLVAAIAKSAVKAARASRAPIPG